MASNLHSSALAAATGRNAMIPVASLGDRMIMSGGVKAQSFKSGCASEHRR